MHSKHLTATILVNNKVMREFGEEVRLPFGSEYSINLKNNSDVKLVVDVSIDGKNIGNLVVVPAYSNITLERFINNLDIGNRFKFIERTKAIENHRGIKAKDGIIEISYQLEKLPLNVKSYPMGGYRVGGGFVDGPFYGASRGSVDASFSDAPRGFVNDASVVGKAAINQSGITVPGGVSHQKFVTTTVDTWDETYKMSFILRGEVGRTSHLVQKPIDVSRKAICSSCGRKNKATAKYCSECGTALILY